MPLSQQRYGPDTCSCKIYQSVDTAQSPPVVQLDRFDVKCPHHAALSDVDAYAAVAAGPASDQKLKNGFEARLQDLPPELGFTEEVRQTSSDFDVEANEFPLIDGGRRLRSGLEYVWEFSSPHPPFTLAEWQWAEDVRLGNATRVLSVWVIGQRLTEPQRAALEAIVAGLNAAAGRVAVRLRLPSRFVTTPRQR